MLIAATGAVVLARRRGETAVVDADLDLLVAAAPSLLAAAAGLVAVRITAPAMRAAAAAVKRRRGVGAFVGFRRQVVQPLSARFPIVVLTMAVSTAVFSSVLVTSITAGQVGASWSAVGADYRVETVTRGVPLPPSVDAAIGESGGTSAGVAVIRDVRVTGSDRSAVVDVLAIDSGRYGEVLADATVGREALGPLLGAPPGEREPVPAVVVGRWPAGKPFTEGEAMTARVGAFQPQFVVAGVVEQFPSVDPARQTLVVDRAALTGVTDHRTTRSAAVFVDAGIGEGDLRELVEGPFARLVSRSDHLSAIAGDPLSIWTRRALWGIVVWSLAMSVVAAVSAVMMSAQARRRDLAVLRVLGLTSRDGAVIAAIEQVPVIVIALLTGVMVGAIAPHLIEPTLDFASFAGGAARVGVEVDAGTIVALCVAMLVVIVLGVAASVRAVDRSEAAKMLRVGDER